MKLRIIFAILLTALTLTIGCTPAAPVTPPPESLPVSPASPITPQSLTLTITSVTSPVNAGASATLTAKTVPGAQCTITVYYKSGPSSASGLYSKTADSTGKVSWTWRVGSNTTPGSWRIVVTAISQGQTVSETTYFTVK